MTEQEKLEGVTDMLRKTKKLVLGDRDLYEKGRLAFVSSVR